jgi:hypothetical protein
MVTFHQPIHFMRNEQMVPPKHKVGGAHSTDKEVEIEMSVHARKQNLGVIQLVTSHYTDSATPAYNLQNTVIKNLNQNKLLLLIPSSSNPQCCCYATK